ncbi:helix-turn-helix transcriptional regulator [Desulfosporosinus sp. PR]|nr:helix-turn-helix transcriptional regulator [Desulfosporosinus sp. PR]
MSILENIQELCKKHKLSIPKLEKEIGLGNSSIYKWSTCSPTVDKLQKVALFFNVSIDDLMRQTNTQQNLYLKEDNHTKRYVIKSRTSKSGNNQTGKKTDINTNPKNFDPNSEQDIAKVLERMLINLESSKTVTFLGVPLDNDTRELVRISLEHSMRLAVQLTKRKFIEQNQE